MTQILLVGNPNCGKTTLFNALTGSQQRVGNWPGVTVEKKTGVLNLNAQTIEITDLPGIYSLSFTEQGSGIDEQITAKAIVELQADLIINVLDACHLERHLYLTSQILELGKPVIIVLNMMDIAKQRGINIDLDALAKQLNCKVFPVQAHKKIGLSELQQTLSGQFNEAKPLSLNLPASVEEALAQLEQRLLKDGHNAQQSGYCARRILEGDSELQAWPDILANQSNLDDELDIVIADARYQKIHEIVARIQQKTSDTSEHFTAKLDRIVLHRYWALPIFFAMMYLMFLFAINIGGAFQDFFDISTDTIFVHGSAYLLGLMNCPQWLTALIAYGVGKGINTTLTFIPVIAAMFFFLSLLESSGYMARAAFVVDKAMRALGLPGKAFVPMIVGFGCNVPAIMAARTLDSERERFLTVLMSPFMSCSARLAIYAVFVAAFFPTGGQNIVFSLYLIGILMAVLTGFILRKTTLGGQASPLILELPAYHKPALKRLLKETSLRLRHFVIRAGRLIIPISVILGGLNALTLDGGINTADGSSHSILSYLGQWLTPIFAPMGLEQDNWPATVGLLTGMLAKEVVVGTLNSLYAQIGHLSELTAPNFNFLDSMREALWSIPHNLSQLGHALSNPIIASAPDGELSQSVYGIMVDRFDGKAGAYAYLLFILLYIPCISTMAVIRQEASRKLMWFSVSWSLFVAYAAAVLFYQMATFASHPQQSFIWLLIFGVLSLVGFGFLRFRTQQGAFHANANS
ncbi:MAG: Fe(2+) transporter permease subunit FeoB [Tatlockia sp.]|nr:Fe(2+) transporter permease subunit FeoB [Tatlockia sp.]